MILSTLEGLVSLAWMVQQSLDSVQQSLGSDGLSSLLAAPMRLGLLVLIAGLTIVLAGISWRALGRARAGQAPGRALVSWLRAAIITFPVFALVTFVLWLILFSAFRLEQLYLYYLRWQPIVVWFYLISLQGYLLAALLTSPAEWVQAWQELPDTPGYQRASRIVHSPWFCLLLLVLAFGLGLTKLVFGQFVDEANNLNYGWLISRGQVMYRDFFTQHFPFTYFWTALVVSLFGASQAAVRVSLLVLYFIGLGTAARLTRLYLPIGLAALAWGMTSHFHRGNLVLYDVLDGAFILLAFLLIFAMLAERTRATKTIMAIIGVSLAFAMLNNPLMVYPAGVSLVFVALSGFRGEQVSGKRESLRRLFGVGIPIAAVLGIYLLYLLVTRSLYDFYHFTIWFNANIYDQYTDGSALRLDLIVRQLATGLDVFNPAWRVHFSPFMDFGVERFRVANEDAYYGWIFSSLLFRSSILLAVVGLLLRRKWLAGLYVYLLAATLLIRTTTSWHTIPFILLSLFCGAYFLTRLVIPPLPGRAGQPPESHARSGWQTGWSAAWLVLAGGFLLVYAWSALSGVIFLVNHRPALTDERYLNRLERFGDEIRRLTCNPPGLTFLEYPFEPMVYFATGIPPGSRYNFLHPWVAQIALPEVMHDLRNSSTTVVEVKTEKRVWVEYEVKDYLGELITFLDENYVRISDTLWMSPEIVQNCPLVDPQIPEEIESP